MLDNEIAKKKYNDCLEFTNECLSFYYKTCIVLDFYEVLNDKNIEILKDFDNLKCTQEEANVIVCVKNKGINIGFVKDKDIYLLNNGNIISSNIEPIERFFNKIYFYKITNN